MIHVLYSDLLLGIILIVGARTPLSAPCIVYNGVYGRQCGRDGGCLCYRTGVRCLRRPAPEADCVVDAFSVDCFGHVRIVITWKSP